MLNQCLQSRRTYFQEACGDGLFNQVRFYLEDEGMVSVLVTSRAQGCGGQFACRRVKRIVDVLGRLQDTLG